MEFGVEGKQQDDGWLRVKKGRKRERGSSKQNKKPIAERDVSVFDVFVVVWW